ncbi:MAG: DUF58 domain-containing protein [Planctomycetes bacterium]|nr:DUF58 domain-containing protein [Planctomycetota bacterium]
MADYRRYLDPKTLNKVAGLELKARLIVEGFVSGQHKSPYKGSSVEFREHREYVPGDDLRFIDWKVFAKSDRFYIKEYEEETNLKAYVVVDTSKSMAFASDGISKLEYAKYVAAALCYLISQQQDANALVLWDRELKKFLPPGNNPLHQKDVYRSLSEAEADGSTDVARLFHDIAERVRQKSMIILLSDLFDDDRRGLLRGLKHMRHKGHDVIVFHVLDRAEIDFPYDRMTLFEGLETDDRLLADPKALREAYLEEFQTFAHEIESGCLASGMDYVRLATDRPLDVALSSYLAARSGTR